MLEPLHDIIVFGATGFTGRLAALKLGALPGIKLAIAGRNRSRLEEIARQCLYPPSIIVADATDRESIFTMVKSGRVLANFAGPFTLYAAYVIEACAELGRAYCDITGETPFIRDMIDRYDQRARASGACLIPLAGFDSVPADLLAFMALREGEARGLRLNHLTHYYQIKGGFNGGTLASALAMAEQKSTAKLSDPNLLIPDPAWEKSASPLLQPTYEPVLKRWSAPFLMSMINTAVVRRSLYLKDPSQRDTGRVFYTERLLSGKGLKGRLEAYAMNGGLGLMDLLTQQKAGRMLLRRLGPAPGEGPSEKARAEGFYKGTLIAREDQQPQLIVTMKAYGDPGNHVTVTCATEVALLLHEGAFTATGFTSASCAFGEKLIARLKAQGLTFSTDPVSLEPRDPNFMTR